MNYTDLTDEELTRTVPTLGPNGTGWLSRREPRSLGLNKVSADYLLTKVGATHQTPARIIDEIIQEKITAAL